MPPISDRELDQLMRQSGRAGRKAPGRCPQREELMAYHQRELSPERADGLREHLAQCETCAAELLHIIEFFALQDEAPETPALVDEVRWRRIAERMAQSAEGASTKSWPVFTKLKGALGYGIGNLVRALWPKPILIFASALVLLNIAGKWYALSQKPRDWDSPHYQALIDLSSEVSSSTRSAAVSAQDPIENAKDLIRRGDFAQAGSNLRKYVAVNEKDWRAHYLLGLAQLSDARRIFIIDFYFDQAKLDRAIASLQRARENAGNNEAAAEEILWLMGRAYAMRGDYAKAADQYHAILQMQYPGQVRRADAEKALRDLDAIHMPGKPEAQSSKHKIQKWF